MILHGIAVETILPLLVLGILGQIVVVPECCED